jgi:hypothetical protein
MTVLPAYPDEFAPNVNAVGFLVTLSYNANKELAQQPSSQQSPSLAHLLILYRDFHLKKLTQYTS